MNSKLFLTEYDFSQLPTESLNVGHFDTSSKLTRFGPGLIHLLSIFEKSIVFFLFLWNIHPQHPIFIIWRPALRENLSLK